MSALIARIVAACLTVVTAPLPGTAGVPAEPLTWKVVATYPHDRTVFTEGLQVIGGTVYESGGLYGESLLRVGDLVTGIDRQRAEVPLPYFAEGLAVVGDRLVQLTWNEGTAFVYDRRTLEPLGTFAYTGEGWGLCYDGTRLFMSDGSSTLTIRDTDTFEVTGTVEVRRDGEPVVMLNELECAGGKVWANVWMSTTIVRIDPGTGVVDGVLDARALLTDAEWAALGGDDVLNGIAIDETGRMFLTGKRWPALYEVAIDQ